MNSIVDRSAGAFADWLRSSPYDDEVQKAVRRVVPISSVLERANANLFWNWNGGAFGISFSYGIAEKDATSNVTVGLYDYWQLLPQDDENVRFSY